MLTLFQPINSGMQMDMAMNNLKPMYQMPTYREELNRTPGIGRTTLYNSGTDMFLDVDHSRKRAPWGY